jgi:hypothetical protein
MEVQPACANYVFSISFLDVGIDVVMMGFIKHLQ